MFDLMQGRPGFTLRVGIGREVWNSEFDPGLIIRIRFGTTSSSTTDGPRMCARPSANGVVSFAVSSAPRIVPLARRAGLSALHVSQFEAKRRSGSMRRSSPRMALTSHVSLRWQRPASISHRYSMRIDVKDPSSMLCKVRESFADLTGSR